MGVPLFSHPSDVIRALQHLRDHYDPRSTSLMAPGGQSDPHAEPFRRGFVEYLDERTEVCRRLRALDDRARRLLVLWHVESRPVTEIARLLRMSRMHCYRVQRQALAMMLDARASAPSEAAAQLH